MKTLEKLGASRLSQFEALTLNNLNLIRGGKLETTTYKSDKTGICYEDTKDTKTNTTTINFNKIVDCVSSAQ